LHEGSYLEALTGSIDAVAFIVAVRLREAPSVSSAGVARGTRKVWITDASSRIATSRAAFIRCVAVEGVAFCAEEAGQALTAAAASASSVV